MKLPTIGVVGQGIDEIIVDGENGFLVQSKNSDSLYDKLKWIYNNRLDAKKIAYSGYNLVVNRFTWLNSAKKLEELYNTVIS